jgi:hypothetical protein
VEEAAVAVAAAAVATAATGATAGERAAETPHLLLRGRRGSGKPASPFPFRVL